MQNQNRTYLVHVTEKTVKTPPSRRPDFSIDAGSLPLSMVGATFRISKDAAIDILKGTEFRITEIEDDGRLLTVVRA